jgi:hypothetical protein
MDPKFERESKPLEPIVPQAVQSQSALPQPDTQPSGEQADKTDEPDQPWYDDVKGTLEWVDIGAAGNATGQFFTGHSGTELGQTVLKRMLPRVVGEQAAAALGVAASAPVALAAAFIIGGIELYEHRKQIWDMTRHGPLNGQSIQDHPAYKALTGHNGNIFA